MKELLQSLNNIREKLKGYGDWLAKIRPEYPNSFNMIFNAATLTLELLDHYFRIWIKPPLHPSSPEEIECIKEENAQRVIEITKWAFVSTLSNIEYSTKEILILLNGPFQDLRKKLLSGERIYLKTIMKKSKEIGLMDEKQLDAWIALIEVRNVIVHNNAIADKNVEYDLGVMKVTLVKGEMLRDKLNFFIKLMEIAIEQHHQWLKTLFNKYG